MCVTVSNGTHQETEQPFCSLQAEPPAAQVATLQCEGTHVCHVFPQSGKQALLTQSGPGNCRNIAFNLPASTKQGVAASFTGFTHI
jgi:uncharacterized protein